MGCVSNIQQLPDTTFESNAALTQSDSSERRKSFLEVSERRKSFKEEAHVIKVNLEVQEFLKKIGNSKRMHPIREVSMFLESSNAYNDHQRASITSIN